MKRIFPQDFWFWYHDDLKKFLEKPRSVLMGFFIPVVLAMTAFVTPWCFVLLILPFIYSFYPAYELSTSKTPSLITF